MVSSCGDIGMARGSKAYLLLYNILFRKHLINFAELILFYGRI